MILEAIFLQSCSIRKLVFCRPIVQSSKINSKCFGNQLVIKYFSLDGKIILDAFSF